MSTILLTMLSINIATYNDCIEENIDEYNKKNTEIKQVLKCNIETVCIITQSLKANYNEYIATLIKYKMYDLSDYLDFTIKRNKESLYILEWLKTLKELVKLYNDEINKIIKEK